MLACTSCYFSPNDYLVQMIRWTSFFPCPFEHPCGRDSFGFVDDGTAAAKIISRSKNVVVLSYELLLLYVHYAVGGCDWTATAGTQQ